MIKRNKYGLIISSIIILLPAIFALIFRDALPKHIMAQAENGNYIPIIALPFILLVLQWVCILFTAKDPQNKDMSRKLFNLVIWIVPAVSLFVNGMLYFAPSLDMSLTYELMNLLFGAMFIILGNYMPKCGQNRTMGIKIKWTLQSRENWNATHRFAGKIWVIGGFLLILCMIAPRPAGIVLTCAVVILNILLPVIYSFKYYKNQLLSDTSDITDEPKYGKKYSVISAIFVIIILALAAVLMFTGNIKVDFGDTSFTVKADYYNDLTVEYDSVRAVEYRENYDEGMRVYGFGSARLLMGSFKNEEFGSYTRYSYTSCDSCALIFTDNGVIALSGHDKESTRAIYETIKSRLVHIG